MVFFLNDFNKLRLNHIWYLKSIIVGEYFWIFSVISWENMKGLIMLFSYYDLEINNKLFTSFLIVLCFKYIGSHKSSMNVVLKGKYDLCMT